MNDDNTKMDKKSRGIKIEQIADGSAIKEYARKYNVYLFYKIAISCVIVILIVMMFLLKPFTYKNITYQFAQMLTYLQTEDMGVFTDGPTGLHHGNIFSIWHWNFQMNVLWPSIITVIIGVIGVASIWLNRAKPCLAAGVGICFMLLMSFLRLYNTVDGDNYIDSEGYEYSVEYGIWEYVVLVGMLALLLLLTFLAIKSSKANNSESPDNADSTEQ